MRRRGQQKVRCLDGITNSMDMSLGKLWELVIREFARKVAAGECSADALTEENFSDFMYSAGVPDPELVIRPSGELRLSNFLLWQSAYSEFVYMNVLWPDFKEKDLDAAIAEFHRRNRRFGGV